MPSYVRPGIRKCAKNRALSRFAHVKYRIRSNEANKKCIASMFVGRVRQCFPQCPMVSHA
ncbi:hypothetical protein GPK50_09985 [Bifidobacterium longum]|nr:hypothetical protein [Bifidobacterium longum]